MTAESRALPVSTDDMRATAERILDTAATMPIVDGEPYRRAAQHLVSAAALIDAVTAHTRAREDLETAKTDATVKLAALEPDAASRPAPASRSQDRRYAIQEGPQP